MEAESLGKAGKTVDLGSAEQEIKEEKRPIGNICREKYHSPASKDHG